MTATSSASDAVPTLTPRLSPEAEAFVRSIGSATDLPAFVRNVRAIANVAADLDARVALLEQAITTDVALTSKVLRVASSALSGTGAAITSVKQAIMLLGYDRVQHLATASSVFNQIEETAPAIKDLLVLSVLTANQSLGIAVGAGYGRPEMAYLCGLFRNLGEVLVACYRARQYLEWSDARDPASPGADGAEEAFFHFTFEEVGIALARQWGMPSELIGTLRRVPPPDQAPSDRLHHITQLSADLTRLSYCAAPEAPRAEAVGTLVDSYTEMLGVERKTVLESVLIARSDAAPTLGAMSVTVAGWMAEREERAAAVRLEAQSGELAQAALDQLTMLGEAKGDDSAAEAGLRAAVSALTAQRKDATAFTIGAATAATLEAARSAGYRRALLALSTEDFKLVRGRMGAGPGSEDLVRGFIVRPMAACGPLGAALEARMDLFVDVASNEGRSFRRDRVLKDLQARCVAVLPLVLENRLMGCLYFDNGSDPLDASQTLRELLCAMRGHLVAAFARHRQAADGTGQQDVRRTA